MEILQYIKMKNLEDIRKEALRITTIDEAVNKRVDYITLLTSKYLGLLYLEELKK